MKLEAPGLENEIVRLELLTEADRAAVEGTGVDEAMWTWMPVIPTGTNLNTYFDLAMHDWKAGTMVPFKIYRQEDGAFAGFVGYVAVSRTHRRLRIGWLWHPPEMRGTAVVPATQLLLIQRALDARIRRIEYAFPEENERAIRAMEKIGVRQEGVLRDYMRTAGGTWANVVVMSLVESEAKAAIALLEDRVRALQQA
ncbi:MAG: GNAT family N-acetyltransferase [Hyphomonas sp.]|nr:GNAT family N-acetyltransferase [Hyphomonas sp.]